MFCDKNKSQIVHMISDWSNIIKQYGELAFSCQKNQFSGILKGYVDVGDGCWRRNVLVTVLAVFVTNILYFLI